MAHGPAAWSSGLGALPAGSETQLLGEALAWHWRPEVLVPLALLAGAGAVGWARLRGRAPAAAPAWRLALHLMAVAILGAALVSPLDSLAAFLLTAHMAQHVLLMMVAAPLLLLADPFPLVLWALPRPARMATGSLLARGWGPLTRPPVAWLGSALGIWLWHLPAAYDAALRHTLVHDLEHLTFFAAGILFWWPVLDPAPRLRAAVHPGLRVVYLVLGGLQTAALGLLIATAPDVLYPSYALVPRLTSLSPLEDQALGGVVMLLAGGLVGMVAVLAMLAKALGSSDQRCPSWPVTSSRSSAE